MAVKIKGYMVIWVALVSSFPPLSSLPCPLEVNGWPTIYKGLATSVLFVHYCDSYYLSFRRLHWIFFLAVNSPDSNALVFDLIYTNGSVLLHL